MKKALLIILLLVWACTTAFAATDKDADTTEVINAIKDIRFNIEAGVNFYNYQSVLAKAGISYRRYADKYPSDGAQMMMTIELYKDAETVWREAIYQRRKVVDKGTLAILFAKYPKLKEMVETVSYKDNKGNMVKTNDYWYEDIMRGLWTMAKNIEPKPPERTPQ